MTDILTDEAILSVRMSQSTKQSSQQEASSHSGQGNEVGVFRIEALSTIVDANTS